MNKRVIGLVVGAVVLLLLPSFVAAAEHVFLQIKEVRGDVTDPKYKDAIECFAYEQAAKAPVDSRTAGGGAAGRTQFDPITIRKKIDRATPVFADLLAKGRQLQEAAFFFIRRGPQGQAPAYTVKIGDVRVVSRKDVLPVALDPSRGSAEEYEEVTFTFTRISWLWEDSGGKIETKFDLKTGK